MKNSVVIIFAMLNRLFFPFVLLSLAILSFAQGQRITVIVDGKPLDFAGASPMFVNERVMVPFRGILERLGAEVDYDARTGTVKAQRDSRMVELTIGKSVARVDGRETRLDAAPFTTSSGRTMVPLRFISEALGVSVDWLASSNTVQITSQMPTPQPTTPPTEDLRINRVDTEPNGWIVAGGAFSIKLDATPGAQAIASFSPRIADDVRLTEQEPGRFTGTVRIPNDIDPQLAQLECIVTVRYGQDKSSTTLRLNVDSQEPRISKWDVQPDDRGGNGVVVYISLDSGRGPGVDTRSLHVFVNGEDYADQLALDGDQVSLRVPNRNSDVQVSGTDLAGLRFSHTFSFRAIPINRPPANQPPPTNDQFRIDDVQSTFDPTGMGLTIQANPDSYVTYFANGQEFEARENPPHSGIYHLMLPVNYFGNSDVDHEGRVTVRRRRDSTNGFQKPVRMRVRRSAPTVTDVTPNNGSKHPITERVRVSARFEDDRGPGLASARFFVNDQPISSRQISSSGDTTSGEFAFNLSRPALTPGRQQIRLELVDKWGAKRTYNWYFDVEANEGNGGGGGHGGGNGNGGGGGDSSGIPTQSSSLFTAINRDEAHRAFINALPKKGIISWDRMDGDKATRFNLFIDGKNLRLEQSGSVVLVVNNGEGIWLNPAQKTYVQASNFADLVHFDPFLAHVLYQRADAFPDTRKYVVKRIGSGDVEFDWFVGADATGTFRYEYDGTMMSAYSETLNGIAGPRTSRYVGVRARAWRGPENDKFFDITPPAKYKPAE